MSRATTGFTQSINVVIYTKSFHTFQESTVPNLLDGTSYNACGLVFALWSVLAQVAVCHSPKVTIEGAVILQTDGRAHVVLVAMALVAGKVAYHRLLHVLGNN